MAILYAHTLSPVLGLLINIISQITIARYVRKLSPLRSLLPGFLIGLAVMFTVEIVYSLTRNLTIVALIAELVLNTITYGSLGYCYFHFINLGETARRVRIVRELLESKDGLSMSELLECYNASEIIDVRIQRLLKNKQIVLRDSKYFIGKSVMLYIARLIVVMKIVILGRKSELI